MSNYYLVTNSLEGTLGWQDATYDILYGYAPRLYKTKENAEKYANAAQNDKDCDWSGDTPVFTISEIREEEAHFCLWFGPDYDREEPMGGIGP
jgi:hypothetical protein